MQGKILLVAMLFVSVLLFGCTQQNAQPTSTPTSQPTVQETQENLSEKSFDELLSSQKPIKCVWKEPQPIALFFKSGELRIEMAMVKPPLTISVYKNGVQYVYIPTEYQKNYENLLGKKCEWLYSTEELGGLTELDVLRSATIPILNNSECVYADFGDEKFETANECDSKQVSDIMANKTNEQPAPSIIPWRGNSCRIELAQNPDCYSKLGWNYTGVIPEKDMPKCVNASIALKVDSCDIQTQAGGYIGSAPNRMFCCVPSAIRWSAGPVPSVSGKIEDKPAEKTEAEKRVFPLTLDAAKNWTIFLNYLKKAGFETNGAKLHPLGSDFRSPPWSAHSWWSLTVVSSNNVNEQYDYSIDWDGEISDYILSDSRAGCIRASGDILDGADEGFNFDKKEKLDIGEFGSIGARNVSDRENLSATLFNHGHCIRIGLTYPRASADFEKFKNLCYLLADDLGWKKS